MAAKLFPADAEAPLSITNTAAKKQKKTSVDAISACRFIFEAPTELIKAQEALAIGPGTGDIVLEITKGSDYFCFGFVFDAAAGLDGALSTPR